MPVFTLAGGLPVIQMQPGDFGSGWLPNTANQTSGFRGAADLHYRETPFRAREYQFELGRPWPMSPFSSDRVTPNSFVTPIGADEWRVVQYGAFAGGVDISAATDLAEEDDALLAADSLAIKATLSEAEAADTVSATCILRVASMFSQAEAGDTAFSAGVLPLVAVAAIAETDDTVATTGTVLVEGALSVVEDNDTLVAMARAPVQAWLSIVEDDDTVVSSFWPVLQVRPRGGPWPIHDDEPAWSRRDWERDLRRIIDEAWRIANGEIDPVTREELPAPDLSAVQNAVALLADRQARERTNSIVASHQMRAEDEAIALLLLAA